MDRPDLIPLQQSDRYAATLRLLGRRVTRHLVDDGAPVQAITRRFGPVSVSYLPRADLSGGRARVLSELPASTARLVIPEAPEVFEGGCWPILTPQHIAEINVPHSPVHDTLWANMHQKWRNRLRRALDGPLTLRESYFDLARHRTLLALEQAQRKRRGYRSYPPDFLAAWSRANPHHGLVLEAMHQDETVAFMLFLMHGPVATYVVGWTGPEGRRLHAHNRLMWEAMRSFFAKGLCRIDLGTVDTEDGAALARFKLGCGARVRTLGPTLLAPPGFRVSP
ncbi:GNAT family N-acetyltransferase [Pseudooceanicola onchidii]|uniref:GNAT family N-acetyltransferase n=1 Tax=Pseudooceanicola onchidii TaxID=2562279 RepID=UPI00145B3041|nr:GNAT family N-acetyltransferase [Pseudooceanicola onchidii]